MFLTSVAFPGKLASSSRSPTFKETEERECSDKQHFEKTQRGTPPVAVDPTAHFG
jgi:hypothetical protein